MRRLVRRVGTSSFAAPSQLRLSSLGSAPRQVSDVRAEHAPAGGLEFVDPGDSFWYHEGDSPVMAVKGIQLPDHIRTWSKRMLDATTDVGIMRELCRLPVEALLEPLVWATVINVFKRHEVSDGLSWAVQEMRARNVTLNGECLANLISAWGKAGHPVRAAAMWDTVPELRDCTGLQRARLLSITAVAFGRNGMRCNREVDAALGELHNHDPTNLVALFSWGRCIQAFILQGRMLDARAVFDEYCALVAKTPYTVSAQIINVMIRGYGDVGDVQGASAMYARLRDLGSRVADSDIDMVRVHFNAGGLQPALKFLLQDGDVRTRPGAFTWLLWRLLEKNQVDDARKVYSILKRGSVADAAAGVMESTVTVEQMQLEFPETRAKHRLYHREIRARDVVASNVIRWADILSHAPNSRVLARFLSLGMAPFSRADLKKLLRKCTTLCCVQGIALLVANRRKANRSFWEDGNLGYEVMGRLHLIWRRARAMNDTEGAQLMNEVRELTAQLLRHAPPPSWRAEMLALACTMPPNAPALLQKLLPPEDAVAFNAAVREPTDLALATRLVVECGVFSRYRSVLLPLMRSHLDEISFGECAAALVPQLLALDEVAGSHTRPAWQREFWKCRIRNAPDAASVRSLLEEARVKSPPEVYSQLW